MKLVIVTVAVIAGIQNFGQVANPISKAEAMERASEENLRSIMEKYRVPAHALGPNTLRRQEPGSPEQQKKAHKAYLKFHKAHPAISAKIVPDFQSSSIPFAVRQAKQRDLEMSDLNKDGTIQLEERALAAKQSAQRWRTQRARLETERARREFGNEAVDKFDEDADGVFSRKEAEAFSVAVRKAANARMETLKPSYDVNKNGVLDVAEMQELQKDIAIGVLVLENLEIK